MTTTATTTTTATEIAYAVRKATREDVPAMADMQIAMAMETEKLALDRPTLLRGIAVPFDRPNVADYYVVEDLSSGGESGKIVAMIMATQEWSDWRAGSILWIQSAYTAPGHRRRGLFAKLYAHVKDIVVGSDYYQGIRLYVETENEGAARVYKSLGMEVEHYNMMKWMKTSF